MMNNKSFEIQNQIRQQALQTHEKLKDLKQWESEMKEKEAKMKEEINEQHTADDQTQKPPVRSKVEDFQKFGAAESLEKMKSMSIDEDNKISEEGNVAAVKRQEASAFKDKGNTFVQKKDYENAIKMYTKAIELCDDDLVYFSNRAQCYLKLEKYKECIEDTNKAIKIDPKHTKSLYRRMTALEKSGEDFKAIKTCQKLLEMNPDDPLVNGAYDRLHNRIMEAEKKKDKEKIRWSRLRSSGSLTTFVTKPPHLRSNRPLTAIPVKLHRAPSPIPEAIIDRIFNNNTGENVPEPETDSKLFKRNFLSSPAPIKVSPPKVAKIELPSTQPMIVEDKKKIDETNEILKANESHKELTLEELESQRNHLITIPKSGPQFYAAWKELGDVHRFLYLKNIADNNANVGKLLGAQLNSEMLSEIINIVHKYFAAYNVPYTQLLNDLGKNSEVPMLAMFLEDEEKQKLNGLLATFSSSGDNAMNNVFLEIKQSFQI